jgi:protoheme ferro-lyase
MHEKVKQLVDVPVSLAMRYGNPVIWTTRMHDKA